MEAPETHGKGPWVTLSGYRRGRYVILDERDDGTLVIAPDPDAAAVEAGARPAPSASREGLGGMLAGLVSRRSPDRPAAEIVGDWGVDLHRDEQVVEFTTIDFDGQSGFAALTPRRLILVALARRGFATPELHDLDDLEAVELSGRGRRRKLRILWRQGTATMLAGPDGDAIVRLAERLDRELRDRGR